MNDIDRMPRAVTANYALWTANTEITLCQVPWDNNYRDVNKFASQAALNAYIDSLKNTSTRIDKASMARVDAPVNLSIDMTDAYEYNYIRVYNGRQDPTNSKPMYYYYFIIGIEYVNPGVTRFMLQLDIWQTFGDKVKFGQCYVERGHVGIANSKSFQNYGRDYLTMPEGLDTGAEHGNVATYVIPLISPDAANFMVITNTDFTADPGNVKNPTYKSSKGQNVLGAPSGADVWIFKTLGALTGFLANYSEYPWVLQGIMQISVVPDLAAIGYSLIKTAIPQSAGTDAYKIREGVRGKGTYKDMAADWRNNGLVIRGIPSRYRRLKKFWTFPYMSIELTFMSGAPVSIKPEEWQNKNGKLAIKTNIVAPGQRIVAYPRDYNTLTTSEFPDVANTEYYIDGGDYLETSTMVGNLPQFAIVNNGGILALANQAHGLAQQYRSQDWSQQKALQGNQTSYDQAGAGIANESNQGSISRQASRDTAGVANSQAIARGAVGAGAGAASGALAGAAGGGVGAGVGAAVGIAQGVGGVALDVQSRNANLAISTGASYASQMSNINTAQYMRDTNRGLADWSARGDYAQSIAAINAKVQDTAMTPAFTSGQAGGDPFNYIFGGINLYCRVKTIQPGQMRAIGEMWLRYGYVVNQFVTLPESLMVMSNFTYWKLSETYVVSSAIPEVFKQAIRGIFEKGVTVWNDPKKIGTIDRANNVPLNGVTL